MSATVYHRRLPHIRVDGSVYFVTWRVQKDQPALSENERDGVVMALRHFDTIRYALHAYVVMDDHVHVLVQPTPDHRLEDIMRSWKSFTANRMQRGKTRQGTIWQDEYFDRIIRNDAEYNEKQDYILNNPYQRWPDLDAYPWGWILGVDP
ncbi:MAG: transposase [Azospirillaceae bacterium]|nr:transposase [Azospirillaceae bacterium]